MAFIVMFTIYSVDKTDKEPNLSLSVAFMISSIYAVIIFGGIPIKKRIDTILTQSYNINKNTLKALVTYTSTYQFTNIFF